MLEGILRVAGLDIRLFTSPKLLDPHEQIHVNGEEMMC